MSARTAGRHDSEEVSAMDSSVVTAGTSSNLSPSIVSAPYKTVWDFEKITKMGGPDTPGEKTWHCGWCSSSFKTWNATKALSHVTKASGNNDVKICTGSIPKATLERFRQFRYQKLGVASAKRERQDAFEETIAENQQSLSVMLAANRSRSSQGVTKTMVDMTGDGGEGVAATNATKLTAAIAEFVFCKGLPFSVAEGEHFRQILKLSKLISTSYRPPNRKMIANELLDLSYDNRLQRYMHDLDVDGDVYGLSLFGDGATVHGMPLMNVLASGVGEPSAVLAIVDCTY